jgi:hypothetical protein
VTPVPRAQVSVYTVPRDGGVRNPTSASTARALEDALRKRVDGEVDFGTAARALYATDASNYRQVPDRSRVSMAMGSHERSCCPRCLATRWLARFARSSASGIQMA